MIKRYEKYSDPLTKVQKRELKHKESKPEGEKKHLKIISFNGEQLVNLLTDATSSAFEKSIAKEEIIRRLDRNQKRFSNQKSKNSNKPYKGYKKFKQQQRKETKNSGQHIGEEHTEKYNEFISNGGDPESCPFD